MNNMKWKESVIYQIYPRSFQDSNGDGVGDLKGIISRLSYLEELGVNMIWLCPVYDSPNDDNGYDIRDYLSIMKEFGTIEQMLELINEAKKRNISIIMDLVANHTSDEHPWFLESRSKKDSDKRNWYIWKPEKDGKEPTNWESIFGGSAWEYDKATKEYYLHAFSKKQPDLNWENPEVREAIYSIMNWWLDKGIAGFRLDAITFLKKNQQYPELVAIKDRPYSPASDVWLNQPGIMEFLQEMKQRVLKPRGVVTVAEAPGVPVNMVKEYLDEENGVFNMIFQFDHTEVDIKDMNRGQLRQWKLTEFKDALSQWQMETEDFGWMALFLENHDSVRSVSKYGNDKEYRLEASKMLASYYMLMRGTPFIYQGQEIGMTNCVFNDIDEYKDVDSHNLYKIECLNGKNKSEIMHYLSKRGRDHGRTPMQWDKSHMSGFTSGTPWIKVNPNYETINVEQALTDENSILNYYKKLIKLRKENKALVYGNYKDIFKTSNEIGGYVRSYEKEKWVVICNFTEHEVNITEIENEFLVLSNYKNNEKNNLKAYESRIYKIPSNKFIEIKFQLRQEQI